MREPSFEVQVDNLIEKIEPAEVGIDPATRLVTISSLDEMDKRHGRDSDKPLEFHNAPHELDVLRRFIRITNLLYDCIPENYRPMIYQAGMVATSAHDIGQGMGAGADEKASVEYMRNKIKETGDSPINNEPFIDRAAGGLLASQVEFAENGEIIQVNLREGEPDPLRFKIAFADINGIAMEGSPRMIKDATNLYFELHGDNPSAEGLFEFWLTQADFLKSRLNDYRIVPDIEYYFPERGEEVYDRMKDAYQKNILSAYRLALKLHETKGLRSTLDRLMSSADKAHLGSLVTKLARKI